MCISVRVLAAMSVLFLSASVSNAQVASGSYPYGTFDTLGPDTINVGNLNVHLSVPVLNKAGRGLPFYYNMSYDSSIWRPVIVNGSLTWEPAMSFGWQADTDALTGYITYNTQSDTCSPDGRHVYTDSGQYNFVFYDTFGVPHAFPKLSLWGENRCGETPVITDSAVDGTGYTISGTRPNTLVVTSPRGKAFTPPVGTNSGIGLVEDANGNELNVNSSGQFTDTTGNVVLTLAGGNPNPQTFTYSDTNGQARSVTMNYQPYTVQTNFGCPNIAEYPATPVNLVSSIVSNDGVSNYIYTFGYDGAGRMTSVTLPAGNTISYTYSGGNNGVECTDGSTAALTRKTNTDSGSVSSTWMYTRSDPHGAGTSHTEVVDGLGNYKEYDFVEASNQPASVSAAYYEVNRSIYQGTTTGPLILARSTCYNYNGAASPCTTTSFGLPISQIDTYETLNGIETHGSTTKFNPYGAVTESDNYDFAGGASSRGGLLRQEKWTYGGSFADLPTADQIYDGSGTLSGQTTYTYDGATLQTTSGVPQHASVTGPRGNLTSEQIYANSSTYYSLSATYWDTGSLYNSTTPNGTTTPSYDSSFVYTTGESLPTPSSGVALSLGATYDTSYTGLPLSSIDPNSETTHITSYDEMLRPTKITYPDGGYTTYGFWNPNQVGIYGYQNSSTHSDAEILSDGYGRQSRVAVANGQSTNPWYQQDTCYDANGNVNFTSYKYQGNGWSTGKVCSGSGGDMLTYDVLGRPLSVQHGDGTSVAYNYNGRATQFTDENGVIRITQVDGLGRTTIVCEISSNSGMPGPSGSPTNCGTDKGGIGFVTSYSYALATGTTTVTQGGQTRTSQTDWLGRTTKTVEPESGTTTYSYAYTTTPVVGLQVIRTKPQANQTNPSVTTTTTTQYDSVGRVVSITYSDGTPPRAYSYDAAPQSWSLNPGGLKGRLALASSGSGSTATGDLFGYDAMGRIKSMWQCAPTTCGTSNQAERPVWYNYDWEGNVTLRGDPGSGVITYTRSLAGEVTSIVNQSFSLTGGSGPVTMVSNVQNGPNGPTGFNMANGLNEVISYDSLGRVQGNWICSGSSSPYCSGGTGLYGFFVTWQGTRLLSDCDTEVNQCDGFGYDEFNRLTSKTVTQGTAQNFSYVYDRWGNRWNQNVTAGSGPQTQLSFNIANNEVTSSGYAYDAAGNLTNDGFHTYTYDAEGNVTAVDGGQTASAVYDALNHKVHAQIGTRTLEYIFDTSDRVTSKWTSPTYANEGHIFWDGGQVAFRSGDSRIYFIQTDPVGTDRVHTDYGGRVSAAYSSLPFGDGGSLTFYNDDYATWDFNRFGGIDYNAESNTYHASFRQYSSTAGRWFSPDPYQGSYDPSNPQSFNRYAYVMNNPLSLVDPAGLDPCFLTSLYDNNCSVVSVGNPPGTGGLGGGDQPGIPLIKKNPFGGDGGTGAPNNDECDNACQLAHAFNKTGVYSLTSVCFPVTFYAASGTVAAGGVAAANAQAIGQAALENAPTLGAKILQWASRWLPTGALTATTAMLSGAADKVCSAH